MAKMAPDAGNISRAMGAVISTEDKLSSDWR